MMLPAGGATTTEDHTGLTLIYSLSTFEGD